MAYATQQFAFGHQLTPWVKRLLIANTAVFLVSFAVGPELFWDWFGFSPRYVLTRPWGAVTYMFLHQNLWHLLMNMLVLFFFGPPLESRWGSNEFLKYYLICGFGGVALSFLFAPQAAIVGASAAIYGLMLAFAWHWPEAPIYVWGVFPVKAKWLVGFFFAVTFVSAFGSSGGNIAHFAHLGGLVTGVAYLKFGNRLSARFGEIRGSRAAELFAIVPRKETAAEEGGRAPRKRRASSPRREEDLLDEVDRILDKISARGLGALTEDERRVLDEVSKKHRTN